VAAKGINPQIVELKTPVRTEETVYIRFRGAELTFPEYTAIETIAAVIARMDAGLGKFST